MVQNHFDTPDTWPRTSADGSYTILERPCGTKRKVKVIAIGAGASGIDLAHAVQTRTDNIELTIYERLPEVGGCWYTSRYPGCACDIPSANYQFTWRPNVWSHFYATAEEIFAYFKGIVDDEGLRKYIKLSHDVVAANWDPERAQWRVTVREVDPNGPGAEFDDYCDVLLNATGFLSVWEWPKIEGLKDYRGTLVHGAAWPKDLDVKDKVVAVIGAGSTAVQIVSSIAPQAKHLYTWIRSPVWVTPAYALQYSGKNGENFEYSKEIQERFTKDPQHYLAYCKMIEDQLNRRYSSLLKGTPEQLASQEICIALMKQRLNHDERLIEKIVPKNFSPGCRRPMPGLGYLEALVKPSATVYTESIRKLTEKGFIDPDGNEVEADIIVCATGLNSSFRPRFPLVVPGGDDLSKRWDNKFPESYLGLAAPGVPNYLIYFGPCGPYAHGSALAVAETYTNYFLQMIEKLQVENVKTFTPSVDATRDFMAHHNLLMKRTVWHGPCSAWYTVPPYATSTPDGPAPLLYPGSRIHLLENLARPRFEDWNLTWKSGNRFEYFGDGSHVREFDGRDLTWYMGSLNGKDEAPSYAEISEEYANKPPATIKFPKGGVRGGFCA